MAEGAFRGRGGGRGGGGRGRGFGGSSATAAAISDALVESLHVGSDLVDIGCNLDHKSFAKDLDAILSRATKAGVTRIVTTGTTEKSSASGLALARKHPTWIRSTAGVHPHDSSRCNERTLSNLERMARDPMVVAIGETGLDFNRNFSPPDVQETWFRHQVELACRLRKPLFCHERDAHESFVAILKPFLSQLPPLVVHCFTGSESELKAYIDLGFYIGLTGFVCNPRGASVRDMSAIIPLDRLMIETDAPFMSPSSKEFDLRCFKSRNEPCALPAVARTLAEARGCDARLVAEATTANAIRFFGLA